MRVDVSNVLGYSLIVERTVRRGDVISVWNAALLKVIRDWTTTSNDPYPNRIVTERPPVAARNLAIGQQVGNAILVWRSSDGASADVAYTPGSEPGESNRTVLGFLPPLLTQWPNVTAFA